MKKRNKKYIKRQPDARMWSWESDRSTQERFVNAQIKMSFGWITVDGALAYNVINMPRNWRLIARAALWYMDGTVDAVSASLDVRGVNLNKLEEHAKEMRKEILKPVKREHIVDVGWICQTFHGKPAENELDLIDLGNITEERQLLWNHAWNEEVGR